MYNKLFTKILDSSIWLEPGHVRLVWITFLAAMDQDGTVALSSVGNVAQRARVTEDEADDAISVLEGPDSRNPGQDNDGRRIERIPGTGWIVLNAKKYRDIIRAEIVREQTRIRVAAFRKRNGNAQVTPSETEAEAETETETAKTDAHASSSKGLKGTRARARVGEHAAKVVAEATGTAKPETAPPSPQKPPTEGILE